MRCPDCGFTNLPGARFCSSCGGRLEAAAAPIARPLEPSPGGPLARPVLVCPHCGRPTTPMPYFARAVNIAKLIVLLPLSVIAPLLFFFIRRDRFVCALCRRLLPGERPVGLLGAFSPGSAGLLPPLTADPAALGPLALATVEAEAAALETRSRGRRMHAGVLGAGSLALLGGASSAGSLEEAVPWVVVSGFFGVASLFSAVRSGKLRQLAQSQRHRQRSIRVLELARGYAGRLNVTTVASHLGIDLKEAEQLLDSLVDGQRVDLQVDENGRVSYVFTELLGPGPGVP